MAFQSQQQKKSGLTSKKQHNGKEKHSVHTEDEA